MSSRRYGPFLALLLAGCGTGPGLNPYAYSPSNVGSSNTAVTTSECEPDHIAADIPALKKVGFQITSVLYRLYPQYNFVSAHAGQDIWQKDLTGVMTMFSVTGGFTVTHDYENKYLGQEAAIGRDVTEGFKSAVADCFYKNPPKKYLLPDGAIKREDVTEGFRPYVDKIRPFLGGS